jgi:hypothetical protein
LLGIASGWSHEPPRFAGRLRKRLHLFAGERSWEQFHTPKNLTAAIAGEAGELAAVLQWYAPGDAHDGVLSGAPERHERFTDEASEEYLRADHEVRLPMSPTKVFTAQDFGY